MTDDPARKKAISFIAEIDAEELAFRLMQIGVGMIAPPGMNPTIALDIVDRNWPSDMASDFPFRRMAVASIEYFGECIEKGQRPS